MVDHEAVVKAMNTKQIIINRNGSHPIKEILKKLLINHDSNFNPKMKEHLDGPGENFTEAIAKINSSLLTKDISIKTDWLGI